MSVTHTQEPNTVPHWLAVTTYTLAMLMLLPMIFGFAASLALCLGPFIFAGWAMEHADTAYVAPQPATSG